MIKLINHPDIQKLLGMMKIELEDLDSDPQLMSQVRVREVTKQCLKMLTSVEDFRSCARYSRTLVKVIPNQKQPHLLIWYQRLSQDNYRSTKNFTSLYCSLVTWFLDKKGENACPSSNSTNVRVDSMLIFSRFSC